MSSFKLSEIQKLFPELTTRKILSSLLDRGYIRIQNELQEFYKPSIKKFLRLSENYLIEENLHQLMEKLDKSPKQQQVFLNFIQIQKQEGKVKQEDVLKNIENGQSALSSLIKKNVFIVEAFEEDRIPFSKNINTFSQELNEEQVLAIEKIGNAFEQKKPVLLHGITGSGKTHIYFELIEKCIQENKQALYLLPEIALTAQIIQRLQQAFGNQIGIYHSRFGNQERVDLWHKCKNNEVKIIIGARSALLLPFHALGLIIVDEEHDNSFKQVEPAPRYHARDTALWLAQKSGANIILGSATPSIESYYNAVHKKIELIELKNRFGKGHLPEVEIIDIKQAVEKKEMISYFSKQLISEIQKSILQGKQIILFQNRRGYAPFVLCLSCGWVPQCEQCDVSLTYHKQNDKLNCHYCGSVYDYISVCPSCRSNEVQAKNFGTERIEEEIKKYFPNARVARFDWDNLKSKNTYQNIVQKFEERKLDILVGTQMVAKGLDFEHVNLVGVLSADTLLAYPDYKVNEKVFQLLEQVSGRAGRKNNQGKVIIQTHRSTHPIIQLVKTHDYKLFAENELITREEFIYPPFCKLIKITLKHSKEETVQNCALALVERLKEVKNIHRFGPAKPFIGRIRGKFLQEIWLKLPKNNKIISEIKDKLYTEILELTAIKNFTNVHVICDVDP